MFNLNRAVEVPDEVLVRIVEGQAVILNLENESYYGLDDVSTDFWSAIVDTKSLGAAVEHLQAEFDVDPETLNADFSAFVTDLIENGLLSLGDPAGV